MTKYPPREQERPNWEKKGGGRTFDEMKGLTLTGGYTKNDQGPNRNLF